MLRVYVTVWTVFGIDSLVGGVNENVSEVGNEDVEGLIDVSDTVGLSVCFEDILMVPSEIAEVGFVTVLVGESVGLFVDAIVWTVISDVSMD